MFRNYNNYNNNNNNINNKSLVRTVGFPTEIQTGVILNTSYNRVPTWLVLQDNKHSAYVIPPSIRSPIQTRQNDTEVGW